MPEFIKTKNENGVVEFTNINEIAQSYKFWYGNRPQRNEEVWQQAKAKFKNVWGCARQYKSVNEEYKRLVLRNLERLKYV